MKQHIKIEKKDTTQIQNNITNYEEEETTPCLHIKVL